MKFFATTLCLFSVLLLASCGSQKFYRPIEISLEGIMKLDSTNAWIVFSVPEEAGIYPSGAVVEDEGVIMEVNVVKDRVGSSSIPVDIKAGMVKDEAQLLSAGYKPASYFMKLPISGRGFRFCNQGGCGDLIMEQNTEGMK